MDLLKTFEKNICPWRQWFHPLCISETKETNKLLICMSVALVRTRIN